MLGWGPARQQQAGGRAGRGAEEAGDLAVLRQGVNRPARRDGLTPG